MNKFLNFSKFLLSLGLVAVVGLVPTTAKAVEEEYHREGWLQFETLTYGAWSYVGHVEFYGSSDEPSFRFERPDSAFDHVDGSNARVVAQFDNVRFEKSETSTFTFEYTLSAQGTEWEYGSSELFTRTAVYGYVDGEWRYLPCTINMHRSADRMECTLTYYGGYFIDSIRVYLEFNVHNFFGSSPFDNTLDLGSFFLQIDSNNSISAMEYTNPYPEVPSVDVPEWDGEYNLDDLPPLDEFVPDSSNPLMVSISKFTNLPVITDMLLVVSVMGVLAYVVFGKRS